MKLKEVNYREEPLGKLSGTGERLPRGPRAYSKPPKKKKIASAPNPKWKKEYDQYLKDIDKTIKKIQSALKLRHAHTKKQGDYNVGPDMYAILSGLEEALDTIEAYK